MLSVREKRCVKTHPLCPPLLAGQGKGEGRKVLWKLKKLYYCIMTIEDNDKMNEEEMADGYQVLAEEHKEFAAMATEIAHEVIPEWK